MASPFQLRAADAADAAERDEDLRELLLRKGGEYLLDRGVGDPDNVPVVALYVPSGYTRTRADYRSLCVYALYRA